MRMPDALKAKIQEAAESNGRSVHAELLVRLEASFDAAEKTQADELLREMRRTQLRLERAELMAEYGRIFEDGRHAAKALAELKKDSMPAEAKELEATVNRARLSKSHLDAKLAALDATLSELSRSAKH